MKKGGTDVSKTTNIAALILLIFFFLVGYLVLLPSEDRAELLDIEIEDEDGEQLDEDYEVLLIKSPGFLSPRDTGKEEKELGSLSLYSTTEQDSENLATSLYISRNLFSNNYQELNFRVEDLNDLTNLGLFFNVVDASGELIVKLNGNTVYQGEASSFDLPIALPLNLLKYTNKLTFTSSSPGINIFKSNYFELKDVSLIRTDKFVNTKEVRLFSIDKDVLSSDVDLEFYVNCLKVGKTQGILKVSLNDKNVFTGRITCAAGKEKVEIRKEYFVDGENSLTFEIDRGDYRLEDINLFYTLKGGENPLYYFAVEEEDLYKEMELKLLFGRSDINRALIFVNRHEISMVSEDEEWTKDISNYVKEGENYIKIIPKNEFEVTHLEIVLVE